MFSVLCSHKIGGSARRGQPKACEEVRHPQRRAGMLSKRGQQACSPPWRVFLASDARPKARGGRPTTRTRLYCRFLHVTEHARNTTCTPWRVTTALLNPGAGQDTRTPTTTTPFSSLVYQWYRAILNSALDLQRIDGWMDGWIRKRFLGERRCSTPLCFYFSLTVTVSSVS